MIQKGQTSQRQLLINRAKNYNISKRLKNNLEEIYQKTERLSQSRCSSLSSQSRRSSRLNYSMEVRQMSPKVKILESIVDKLKCPKMVVDRKSENSTEDNVLRDDFHQQIQIKQNVTKVQVEKRVQQVTESSPTRHKNKLQTMLKVIKRCNQQSTKAVSTIKKGIPKHNQETTLHPQSNNIEPKSSDIKQQISDQFAEVVSLREQLRKIKEENKLLIQIIKINQLNGQINHSNTSRCSACGCSCTNKTNRVSALFQPKKDT